MSAKSHNFPRLRLPRSSRLRLKRDFRRAFGGGIRHGLGPLTIVAVPNDVDENRLALAVPRRVGGAVTRNRVKRLLREAFRLRQHELPGFYDLVVVVRPHALLTRPEYETLLVRGVRHLDQRWRSRAD